MKRLRTKFVLFSVCTIFATIVILDRSSLQQNDKRYVLLGKEITGRNICDSECQKFRELMKHWPQGKPKAAIIILTQTNRTNYLQHGLRNLDEFFLNNFSYPIIIFHEMDYKPWVPTVRTWTNASVFFQEVKFEIPSFLNRSRIPEIIQNRRIQNRRIAYSIGEAYYLFLRCCSFL